MADGFNVGGFGAVTQALQGFVDRGDLAGVVTLTWRKGEVLQSDALGFRDLEAKAPMTRDTLFYIASMTKPVTTAAALMLMDEGKLSLSDPISRWAPEFADMRVLKDPAGPLDATEPAARPITVEDLMTHRAGLAYDFSSRGPIAKAHTEALGSPLFARHTPDDWMAALAGLPLTYQPGERMHYSQATDVLGFLVARIDGKTLRESLRDRIFTPLGMADTDFWVAPQERGRIAKLYKFDDAQGHLVHAPLPMAEAPQAWAAGGGGLISTADDYLRFARMLLAGGEVDGVRLLKRETVADMRANRLTPAQREDLFLGMPMWAGMGFGLGLSLVDAPARNILGTGSVGSFGWPGAFGTWWQADPVEDLVMLYMIAHQIELSPDAGAALAAGRGMAGRMALPAYQRLTYEALQEVRA